MAQRIAMLMLVVLLPLCTLAQETKDDKKQRQLQELKELVDSGSYEFTAQWAYPLRNNLVYFPNNPNLSSAQVNLIGNPNYIRIKKDSAEIAMPFFGVARNAPYGGGTNEPFDDSIDDYKVKEKKGKLIISFTARKGTRTDNYTITANTLENVDVTVTSSWRDTIRYRGEIKPLEEIE
ncbi:MAG: hypothetical protein CL868_10535 [Cytophagaceae bacterium]|nr:hypothetical protein [Cytophagaceae bacterium]|tara:strand:+ start:6913 stop:7446 length:534 start_codon:yes stop_codon:yes gene_type:complete